MSKGWDTKPPKSWRNTKLLRKIFLIAGKVVCIIVLVFRRLLALRLHPTWKGREGRFTKPYLLILKIFLFLNKVYQFLQYNYVIPFYQSENYLGFLCGAPPEFDELIRGIEESNDDEEKFPKVLDSSFSLSQFRFFLKFFKF